jgi:vancomycin resistance protein VanJ
VQLRRAEKLMLGTTLAYGGWLVFVWLALRLVADHYWWATVLLFTPRWFWAIPLPLFVVALPLLGRRWLSALAMLTLGVLAVMHVEVPWRKLIPESTPRQTLKVLTCNCDSGRLSIEAIRPLIAEFDPDIVALQTIQPEDFASLFDHDQWHTMFDFRIGLASRYPIRSNEMLNRPELMHDAISLDDFRRYELDVDGQTLHFANLHLQSPRFGLRAVIAHLAAGAPELEHYTRMRRLEADAIHDWLAPYPDVLIAGDFNTPLESPTYRRNFGGYTNAFSTAGWGLGDTFQPEWWSGLRIDHVLAGTGWWCRSCRVGPAVGAEHRPVLVEWAR